MFTGIVQDTGIVRALERRPGGASLDVETHRLAATLRPGDSMAVNGTCLTVVRVTGPVFRLELMPETLRRTNLGGLRPGAAVNLEPPLRAGDPLGGHFVQGHIDGTGRLLERRVDGEAVVLTVELPVELEPYVVPKGFVALDGVSLTVVERRPGALSVSIVRETQERTTLTRLPAGASLNIEVDILAKYAEALLGARAASELPSASEFHASAGGGEEG